MASAKLLDSVKTPKINDAQNKIYPYEEVFSASQKYFNGNDLAASAFVDKYALRDSQNNFLEKTPDDMHRRIAREISRIDKQKFSGTSISPMSEDEVFYYLKDFEKIIPQGSPMYGIGNPYQYVSLGNCYVSASPEDSYGSILKTDEEIVQISKRRGGVGTNLDHLRPTGFATKNAARTSTGVPSFMQRFSNSIREVGQSGRRGALLLSISIHHPDTVKLYNEEEDGPIKNVELPGDQYTAGYKTTTEFYNPNKLDFASIKLNKNLVTGANVSIKLTDEFMNAVAKGEKFEQRWPVDSKNPKYSNWIDARAAWKKICHIAYTSAEPGLLLWDNIIRESPADCYADLDFRTVSTNPCITGDTLVYVADGRGNVPIKQLSDEGKDVDVFCLDDKNNIVIRTMRHPRKTADNQPIYKVTFDDSSYITCTGNHKIKTTDNEYKEASKLKYGDSILTSTKWHASIKEIFKANSNSQDYIWLSRPMKKGCVPEHRIVYSSIKGPIPSGHVIHHKDYNALNNTIENLECMHKKDHDELHSKDMIGDKNPMRRAKTEWSEEKWADYRNKQRQQSMGLNNKNAKSDISNRDIFEHAKLLTNKLGYRFSKKDWMKYAKDNDLPIAFTEYRESELGNVVQMSYNAAIACGLSEVEIHLDPRLQRTLLQARKQGYEAKEVDGQPLVKKICEATGKEFWVNYFQREISFISNIEANRWRAKNDKEGEAIRIAKSQAGHKKSAEKRMHRQLQIYTELKQFLGRRPKINEWEQKCKEAGVSYRLGKKIKYGFKSYSEICEDGDKFNHRVEKVEVIGKEDVYSGTVDEFHNYFSCIKESETKSGKPKFLYINNRQCGELPLCSHDSCRLLLINLMSCVDDPFTDKAKFNYERLYKYAQVSQRFMDNFIELELEKLDAIIAKLKRDP